MRRFLTVLLFFSCSTSLAADAKPKYGSEATPLSVSHEYFQKNPAPLFWTLIPYYEAQRSESTCSVATVAMVVNSARAKMKLGASDELATEAGLLKKVKHPAWRKILNHGVTLDELGPILEESLRAYGIEPIGIEVVHVQDLSQQTRQKLHESLNALEKSSKNLIVINFLQSVYTNDADVGHISPLAAYDSAKRRALVLDTDRKWYEPYWVSEETLFKGMHTLDKSSGKNRGYVRITLP